MYFSSNVLRLMLGGRATANEAKFDGAIAQRNGPDRSSGPIKALQHGSLSIRFRYREGHAWVPVRNDCQGRRAENRKLPDKATGSLPSPCRSRT